MFEEKNLVSLKEILEQLLRSYISDDPDLELNDYETGVVEKFMNEFCKEFYNHSFARR